MSKSSLHEIAKFAAGIVAAEFLWTLWFSQQGMMSAKFFGVTFVPEMVLPTLIFDMALFIILVHYAWHIGKIPQMRERTYILVAGCIFSVIAAAHLFRIFTGADLVIEGWSAPLWLSWFGIAVTTYLAYASFHFVARLERTTGKKKR